MEEAGDICVISIPFAAGVLLASFIKPGPLFASVSLWLAVSVLVLFVSRKGRCEAYAALLFFLLGNFCYSSDALRGSILPGEGLTDRFIPALNGYIGSLPFKRDDTVSIISALLSGDRSGIDRNVVKAFRESGAAHILALSGLHLGVIYLIISKPLSLLGNSRTAVTVRSISTIAICGTYTILTGASPSLFRAFFFIVLNEISTHCSGRRHSPVSTLCTVLTLQLIINPQAIETLSFQLSYLAVAGIVLIYPLIDGIYPYGHRLNPFRKIWSSVALSTSCQITTAPLVWMRFHSLPRYFILTNLIALPLSEAVLVCAVVTMLLHVLFPGFSVGARICDKLVEWLVFSLKTISSM